MIYTPFTDPTQDPLELAYKRAVMILLGAFVALFFGRLFFPYLASKQLRLNVSDILFRLGAVYILEKKLTSLSWQHNRNNNNEDIGDRSLTPDEEAIMSDLALIEKPTPKKRRKAPENIEYEEPAKLPQGFVIVLTEIKRRHIDIQALINETMQLLEPASKEPKLRSRFPAKIFKKILLGCEKMLSLHRSMTHVASTGFGIRLFTEVMQPINTKRIEMSANVVMFYYILASSLRTKAALPVYLPPALKSRTRVLKAFHKLNIKVDPEKYKQKALDLYYWGLYSGLGQSIIFELEHVGKHMFDQLG